MTDQPPNVTRTSIEQEWDHLKEVLDAVTAVIDKHSGDDDVIVTDSSVRELKQIARSVEEDTKEMLEEGRLLRLGIVGQVKAGKSSLLNLLLFDGQEVLPKAATPMTASLTHIVKSDRDEIEIEYYTAEDWKKISDDARKYERAKRAGGRDIEESKEVAAQLVEMADKNGINVHEHLGKRSVHQVQSTELNDQLRHFVGSEGALTPLVKSVTIRSSQGMADLDIVDTPGINDPIISRSRQAERMLSRCDAVLLLSYAAQFMDSLDATFFGHRIPQQGIRHCLVIGSKFDSALVDVSRDHRGRLDEAKADTERRLKAHADEAVARLVGVPDTSDTNDGTQDVALISAMCAALAKRPCDSWAPDERHAFETLQRAYPDWLDQPERDQDINQTTRDNLVWIGNRAAVDDSLKGVRANKDSITAGKITDFLREKHIQVLEELAELISSLEERKDLVEASDIGDIESQQNSISTLLGEIETKVTWVWDDLIEKRRERIDDLRKEIREATADARDGIKSAVRTKTKTRIETVVVQTNLILPDETRDEIVEEEKKKLDRGELETTIDRYSEQVIDGARSIVDDMYNRPFANHAVKMLVRQVNESLSNVLAANVNVGVLKRALREAVVDIVQRAEEHLKNAHRSFLDSADFTLDYEGNSLKRGQKKGRKLVKDLRNEAMEWLDSCEQQINVVQDRAKADLVPATLKELERYQKRLKKDIAEKQFRLNRYGSALDELKQARDRLENLVGTSED